MNIRCTYHLQDRDERCDNTADKFYKYWDNTEYGPAMARCSLHYFGDEGEISEEEYLVATIMGERSGCKVGQT
jgi:hypothetical protein